MARPIKLGLDYFPLDTTIDDNLELLEAECGLVGFAIIIKLWQKIYTNGYYIEWDEDNVLLFARKLNMEVTAVNSVINVGFKRNLFDKTLHKQYKILTSSGIQKRYFKICTDAKRKNTSIIKEYNLLTTELTKFNLELTSLTPEESTQSKVEDIKVEEIKENISYTSIFNHYIGKGNLIKHNKITTQMKDSIKAAMKELSIDEEEVKKLIDRHSELVELTKNDKKFPVPVRRLDDFFGQHINNIKASPLRCQEYLEGGKKYNYLNKTKKEKNKPINGRGGMKSVGL